jgi:hypothetical protein
VSGRAVRAGLILLALLGAGVVAALLIDRPGSGSGGEPAACNGAAALCGRRLDQVVFPATHNAYAASEQPGWHFAPQRYGIARQLDDGIRALTLDVHYGVPDPSGGAVRTDLRAEGSDRNKVARRLPAPALRVADQVAGRVGAGTLAGKPELYLCHTLCELGAEPLDQELEVIRRFLDRHPREVLILIVEDYVLPASVKRAFADAGLERDVATLDRDEPLPTLEALIADGRRLVVFAEQHGGSPAWYMPAFSFIQDTPLGAIHPGQLSCRRYRGEPDSPLLLVNHWIPPFPPSVGLNEAIGRRAFLRARVQRCMRTRGADGAIVAVDFYERTTVVAVARQLNGRR